MIKKLIFPLFILCTVLTAQRAFAQQPPIGLAPLSNNPRLAEEHQFAPKTLFPAGSKYYFFDDTLGLPFIDDFSKDRFKDFRLYQYPTTYQDSFYYFRAVNYSSVHPDSVWYMLTKPDSFQVTSPDTFQVIPSTAPKFKLYIYDTLTTPFAIIDSIEAWPFIPKMIDVVNNVPIYADDFFPDGKIYNRLKHYTMVPASPNDKSLWIDRNVYVSVSMPVKPPTIGVAVFDGIRMDGMPYNHNSQARGIADYLTSKPLNLSTYVPGDSLYLSFYVQPQGLGFAPAVRDTIVLEFKAPGDPEWHWMWSSKGGGVQDFRHIRVAVKDVKWLVKGFQFRFKNYATLNANTNHWLLDYVRLDEGRNINDTLVNDVAFVSPAPSILRDYQQMPARQFDQPEVDQKWDMMTDNLWNQCKWITYGHTTFDENGNPITSYPAEDTPGAYDTSCVNTYYPGQVYNNNFRHSLPSFSYVFDVQDPNCCPYPDSIAFTVRHVLTNLSGGPGTSPAVQYDVNTGNDTIYRHQTFYNYYAYDDGEAEACMFLGQTGQIAYEFKLNFADTLRAIQFYFDPQSPNVSNNTFELRVWRTLNNTSEDTAYAEAGLKPIYNNTGPNRFTTYILNRPVVLPAGKFYIGWRQNTQYRINIGYDRNVNTDSKMFYKTTGQWLDFASIGGYEGSLMMRPVLGRPVTADEFLDVPEEAATQLSVNVYPNPSSGIFYYDLGNAETPSDLEIQVLDLSGKVVFAQKATFDRTLDLNHLTNGIYFTRFVSRSQALNTVHKLILSK